MSRNGNKKPVGFATHIIAGGIAGGCEAVLLINLQFGIDANRADLAYMPAARHNQGPNAALEIGAYPWGESSTIHQLARR